MKASILLSAIILLLVASVLIAADDNRSKTSDANLSQILDHDTYIDINSLLGFVYNDGTFCYDNDMVLGNVAGLYFPRGTEKTVIYSAGLWLGAKVNGQLRIAVAEYNSEYVPGPMTGGTFQPDSPDFKVYKINRGDDNANPDYLNWPTDQGAPVDQYGNPLHFGDQTLWSAYNDADPLSHNNDAGSTEPLGIEIQHTSGAFNRVGALGRTIFMKFLIINKGGNQLEDMYVSLWADPDIGHSGDDLIGCDTSLSLGYCYNDGTDNIYGEKAPAVGFTFLQGPLVDGLPDDSGKFMGQWYSGRKNLPMSSFNKYINGTDPHSPQESYNYMQGLEIFGNPVIDPNGDTTTFYHAGDPVTGTGWIDDASADRRYMLSAGPFNMMPGDSQEVIMAIVVGQGNNNLQSIVDLRQVAQHAQEVYLSDFSVPLPNDNYYAYGRGMDQAVDLIWGGGVETHYQDFMDQYGEFYVFEGYNIYQGETENGPWTKIMTFDMTAMESQMAFESVAGENTVNCYDDNGTTVCDTIPRPWDFNLIYNWVVDQQSGGLELKIVQSGNGSGIENHLVINEDHLAGGPLMNGIPYYFAVSPYLINIEDVHSEDSVFAGLNFLGFKMANLESSKSSFTVVPEADPEFPLSDTADHIQGNSDGMVIVEYVDFNVINTGYYTVTLNPDETWNLERDGMFLLTNQENQSGDYDYPVIDGIMPRVIGSNPGIASVLEIETSAGPIEPDNVFWSMNSSGDYYVSSDFTGSDQAAIERFNWRGNMENEAWEFRFTAQGSEYYDWTTDFKFPNRAPFEIWHFTADDTIPDQRDIFWIIDDDGSGGWSWGDRIYVGELEYPAEPLPPNAGDLGYVWDDDFHLGRLLFNDYSGMLDHPEFGTVVRFNTTKPNTTEDIFAFRVGGECGDANADQTVNITDAVYIVNFLFLNGSEPVPFESGDVNCDSKINLTDAVYMITYVFQGGHPPCDTDGDGNSDC